MIDPNKPPRYKNKIVAWIEYRLPVIGVLDDALVSYKAPKNLNYAWNFGSLSGIGLMIQIITGIILAMHYTPHAKMAFDSTEHIMRDVNYGWLWRYVHATGASMFFAVTYMHLARGMYYGSYKPPRELLWWFGVVIFLLMMATGFLGYVLPWGQMSFWGATVITNLFSAIPFIGEPIVTWLWGGFSVDNPTLNRFFALHYLLPFVLVGLVFLHIVALHTHGSNNPSGVPIKDTKKDTVSFHPYYTVKDAFGLGVFFTIFAYFVFFSPNSLGHPDNYIPADPMVTPEHIVPEWYFLPFYAILRAVPSKLGGVIMMFSAIAVLFVLPYLDTHKTKSGAYRPWFKKFFFVFAINAVFLGWLGGQPAEGVYIYLARGAMLYYFGYFLVILPLLSKHEKTLPEPESIDEHYKSKH